MSIEIVSRWDSGKILYTAESAAGVRAALVEAVEKRAYLQGAYLQGADLQGAYLQGAYLQGADLQGADLQGAYLRGADLRGALGLAPERVQPLLLLLEQPGTIRAYKLVAADGRSPITTYPKLRYAVGETVEVENADTDVGHECGAGVNVGTLDWCLAWWKPGFRVLIVEFTADQIAAIPTASDGKFRLRSCRVVGEKELDPVALGLVKSETKP